MDVDFEIDALFSKVQKSHRAVAGLDVPTDAPTAEPVPHQPEEIIGLVIVVYAEAPVIALDAKVSVLGQVPEGAQADQGHIVGEINGRGTA